MDTETNKLIERLVAILNLVKSSLPLAICAPVQLESDLEKQEIVIRMSDKEFEKAEFKALRTAAHNKLHEFQKRYDAAITLPFEKQAPEIKELHDDFADFLNSELASFAINVNHLETIGNLIEKRYNRHEELKAGTAGDRWKNKAFVSYNKHQLAKKLDKDDRTIDGYLKDKKSLLNEKVIDIKWDAKTPRFLFARPSLKSLTNFYNKGNHIKKFSPT